ncbi:serpin family protein [Pontibacter anaerobius]|uniref:Serpin family protein n=1 Tax=Pontibacter anaerobius TaxID=2993940 RepID=A0ABT3RHU3_9BACT|nr:serpin family protein [Pontibacter anaerobius]MCX2741428.1 serpin family protein [Pontibacter anaerobius]
MYRNLRFLSIAAAAALLFSACQPEDVEDNTPNVRPLSVQEQKTIESSNDFAFRSFAKLSEEEDDNVFISPLSISMALTMTYNGADGTTKEAMRQTLGFDLASDEDINKSYKELAALLKGIDKKVVFTSANSLWHNKDYTLRTPFVELNKTYFDATVQGLNFSSPAAKDQMNNWVKEKTSGKITSIIEETSANDVLFLLNAIYFKGTWTYKFDKSLTKPGAFFLEDGSTVTHDFMWLKKGKYLSYEDASKRIIDLPYGNEQFSMTLVIPTGQHKVQDVVQELSAVNLKTWLASADTSGHELLMPKFKLEYKEKLNDMLTQLGMGVAFTGNADFSRMVEGNPGLAISKVMHKTFVEVNEEGTEAAAVTSVGIEVTSANPSPYRIDRPFIFMIREKSSNAILFIGKLMQPE